VAVDHWSRLARLWSLLGPPLRPSPEDVAIAESVARAWRETHATAPLHAVILGVTPELATLRWPGNTVLLAIDESAAMIDGIWPREGTPPGSAARPGDWRRLDLPDASVDLVLGDGCFTVLAYPDDHAAVIRELHRVLRPGGRLVVRAFALPETREELADVGEALWAGRIGSMNALKWRLGMAFQPPARRAVAVVDMLEAFHGVCPDPSRLVAQLGWAPDVVATVESYRNSTASYSFCTLAELRALLAPHFTELSCHVPGYELGDRCPTLVLEPCARR
jgi:SAM-dependent methyltransferase